MFGLMAALAPLGRAQTILVNEGFEGVFPGTWVIGDSNAANGLVYWRDVNSTFGTVAPHTGGWKGYCAGNGYLGTTTAPLYATNMQAYMRTNVNLTGFAGANLNFWYAIPSIESFDRLQVFMDGTELWRTNAAQSGWQQVCLPLNAYLGGTHTLRFNFFSDVSVIFEGAYLDDVAVRASTVPFVAALQNLTDANYSGYVLASDYVFGRSNIQAQATMRVENFAGGNAQYTNVLSFRLINANLNAVHPIYSFGNVATNVGYTYNVTNILSLAAGTNVTLNINAFLRPAAWMNHLQQYYLECRMLTNGVLAQVMTSPAQTYYHFTNTVSGDSAYNVLVNMTDNSWSRTYAVNSIPGQDSFRVNVDYEVRRWDDLDMPIASANIPVVFNYTLRDQTGALVPLTQSGQTVYDSIPSYDIFFFAFPSYNAISRDLDIRPAVQLDSVNKSYYLTATISHTNNPVAGQVLVANTLQTGTNQLAHFNGNLIFGSIGTTMTGMGISPVINPPAGTIVPTSLNLVDGYVSASPGHTYSGGGPLAASLNVAGDAIVTAGSVVLTPPAFPDNDIVGRVRFQRGPITLSSSGASGDVTVTLPPGFGYRLNNLDTDILQSKILFAATALNGLLDPAFDLTYSPGAIIYAAEESKPAWLHCDKITWHILQGRFDLNPVATQTSYVRADEYVYLQSVSNSLVNPPSMADKRSNEKYWLALTTLVGAPSVRADNGSNAVLSTTFRFNPGGFDAHFPYDTEIKWTGAGSMQVSDDLVVPGSASALGGALPVGVSYTRDCPDCGGAGGGVATPTLISSNGLFSFTRDGGIVAGGATIGMVDLQWGYIGAPINDLAQQALDFGQAAFHMPGAFLRGTENLLADVHGASTILYSGFAVSNLNIIERPLSIGYSRGYADYAGMNFRCLSDNAYVAQSTIAGQPGIQWKLTGRSKYCVRYAGVSGIHESVLHTFPSNLTLWGYDFTFTSYGLSYLDSINIESRTDGAIDLPYPSDFIQGFDNMKFSCLGAPLNAEVPQGDGFKLMSYWLADFKTLAIQFKSKNSCDPSGGYLVLGIEGYASHVDKPLYGNVGFFNNGDQIPRSFGLEGVDSRLRVPNVIKMEGANKTTYYFTPVANVYYNTHAGSPPGPDAGWMNIYGKMDVPFFEDLQLHLQTSCHTNGVAASNAPIYLSGGWPRAGSSNPNYGWVDPSLRTPFETNHFDWPNVGWPGGIAIADYRDNSSAQDYHPRAQRLWLGVIDFDYPLSWDRTQRSFKSWKQKTDDFLVLSVQHEVKYMDAKQAELTFGAQYDGLPSISIANLAFNALDDATGVGSAIVQAAAQPVFDVLNTGLDELNQLLDTQMHRMMSGVFDRTIDPLIDNLYGTLSNQWANAWYTLPVSQRQQFILSLNTNLANMFIGNGLTPVADNLSAVLRNLGSTVSEANNIIGQVQTFLGNASNAIASVVGVISTGTNGFPLGSNVVGLISKVDGGRPIAPKLVQSLVGEFAPQFIDAVAGPVVSNLLQQVEPALTTITETLNQTKDAIAQVEGQLESAGAFTQEIDNTIKSFSSEMTNVSIQVSLSVTQYFGQLNYNVDNPFQHISAADVKKFVRQKIEDQFFSTDAAAQVQTIMRQRLYDLDAAMKEQIDSVFQELNNTMRSLISQSLAEVDNTINKALGEIEDVMGAGQINGHALIDGDSLKLLRLDGHFQWKAPDAMEFNAFLEIKELDSDGTPGCSSPSGTFTEVTLGATDVSLDWVSPDLSIDVATKFTFDGTIPFPVNFAGSLQLNGNLTFEAFELHDLACALAFGRYENYLALKGGVRFNSYDFSGAIFFGRTCTLDPLYLIDPDVAGVLGNAPFTGVYVYAQGWLPISEIVLGIPASCFFNISAGVGAGAFYFVEGPTFGGKMFLGVSAELLCIVTIEGDITMIGVKAGDDLRFKGTGHFEAEVGPCPFCISVSKDISITYIKESWSIDY